MVQSVSSPGSRRKQHSLLSMQLKGLGYARPTPLRYLYYCVLCTCMLPIPLLIRLYLQMCRLCLTP